MPNRAHRPEVVLVPGFMQGPASWAGVVERMGGRYRAVVLDHRSHDLAGRLAEIERDSPPGAALVGYSLGGRLALHAALRARARPGRFAALATLGASAGIEDPVERGRRRAVDGELADWIEANPIAAVVDRWEQAHALADQPPELVAAQRPDRLAHDPRRLAQLLRSAGQGAMPPVWDRLRALEVPVLALAGERDHRYVAAAERMAALAPVGRAQVIPRAGHAAHFEQPDAFARALLEFLDEHLLERRVVDGDA